MSATCFPRAFPSSTCAIAKNPRAVNYIAAPPNTWNIHLQTHDDLLLVIHAKDMFAAAEFADERAYYSGQLGKTVGTAEAKRHARLDAPAWRSMTSRSRQMPRQIGFMPVEGGGIHRVWYTGGRWAYVSALLDGFTDYIFITIDMSDPGEAARSRPLVDSRHEPGGRRDAIMAGGPAASACITRSFTATPPTPPGAMPAWSCSMSPTAPSRN